MEETRYIGRANLTKRLTSLEGQVGRTRYRDGSARLEYAAGALTVTPPFGLGHEGEYERVVLGPLFEALGEDHTVAALLVRLGGYALGIFVGERLVASKVGSRFVKGRHRAGGSSANRFRRRRQGQERELVEEAAAEAARLLTPWQGKVEWIALGGDRAATRRVLAARADLAWMQPLALERFFAVPPAAPTHPRRAPLPALRRQGSRALARGHAASSGSNSCSPHSRQLTLRALSSTGACSPSTATGGCRGVRAGNPARE